MSRTLKILLIVAASGLLLLAVTVWAFFRYVGSHKDEWLTKGRDTMQEAREAGRTLRDAECLDKAVAMHLEGDSGFAGLGARLWLNGCLQTATPTAEFCRDVPAADDIAGSIGWQMTECGKHGLTSNSTCGGTMSEVQKHCQARRSANGATATTP